MSDDYAKLGVQRSLNQIAINKAQQAVNSLGRALPCRVTKVSGAIVTVAFEVDTSPWTLEPITIPKAESNWLRMPTQVGDLGVTAPSDLYLGGISGLGGGRADMRKRGNLSTLYFVPISSASSGPIDPNAAQVQGPNGVVIKTTTGTTSEVVTNQNGTTITFGNNSLTLSATGLAVNINGQTFTWGSTGVTSTLPITTPDVIVPNGSVNSHYHGGVQTGTGNTGTMTG
ncbi:TPA: hypothetical protein QDC06_000222 [Burkholderia cepacia]|nr:hypothetical protein BZY94_06125 [Burkholderia territorii]HDR9497037.1 hypothetical protein [Burkholderia cepacia]